MYTHGSKEKKETSTALIVAVILALALLFPSHSRADELITSSYFIQCEQVQSILQVEVAYTPEHIISAKVKTLDGNVIVVFLGLINKAVIYGKAGQEPRIIDTSFMELFRGCTEVDAI